MTEAITNDEMTVPLSRLGTVVQMATSAPSINCSGFRFLRGDAMEQLRTLPDESVHTTVCDPPYGLSSGLDVAEMLECWLKDETFINDADGYDGTTWDNSVPGPELWREVYRTMVPGAFLLAFAATRTVGLTQVALQLAGFELRDLITWVYAPGRQATPDLGRRPREDGDKETAAQLGGWRTTLRPGYEPILVARKPFEVGDTCSDNLIDFGVGAINHDLLSGVRAKPASNVWTLHDTRCSRDECQCHLSGHVMSEHATSLYPRDVLGDGALNVAKPRRDERPVVDGTGHETVKPLALIRLLIEAVTRPGQVVLDPFLGSGTTAEAALLSGRRAIGCEREPRYWPLIEARIARAKATKDTERSVRQGSYVLQGTSVRPRAVSAQLSRDRTNPGEPTHDNIKKEEVFP